jgi:regulation of enolase protein 1 (concanavalin A-like superfamily)
MADALNFVRLERATLHRKGQGQVPYANFEIRVDGKTERFGSTSDMPIEDGKPTWLRLERCGREMRGAFSQDGRNWTYGTPKQLKAAVWSQEKVQAGVHAVSLSRQPFNPQFSEFVNQEVRSEK